MYKKSKLSKKNIQNQRKIRFLIEQKDSEFYTKVSHLTSKNQGEMLKN
jgi:hypothetical protein